MSDSLHKYEEMFPSVTPLLCLISLRHGMYVARLVCAYIFSLLGVTPLTGRLTHCKHLQVLQSASCRASQLRECSSYETAATCDYFH